MNKYIIHVKSKNPDRDVVYTGKFKDAAALEDAVNKVLKDEGFENYEGYEYMKVGSYTFTNNCLSPVIETWVGAGCLEELYNGVKNRTRSRKD